MAAKEKNKIMPKLRFNEFTGSWPRSNISDVCTLKGRIGYRGYTTSDIVERGKGAITLSPSNISKGVLSFENSTYISWFKYEESPEIKLEKNDILLVKTGSTYGKSAFVNEVPEPATINPQIVIMKNIIINPKFLGYVVGHEIFQKQIESTVVGGAIPTLSQENINNFKIPNPSLPEQEKIAEFLGAVDEKIQQLTRKKQLLEQYKKGIMQQLFSGKLRFKDENGKAYPKWEEKKLGPLIQIKSGYTPSNYNFTLNGINPFLKVEELNNSEKYQSESRFYTDYNENLIKKNSVIFPKRGAAILNNKVRINTVDVLIDTNLMALIPIEGVLYHEYLYYKIFSEKLYKIADCSTIPQINNKHIEPYKIPLPSFEEQKKIADFLSSIDAKINKVAEALEATNQFKKGLLQQMFV